MVYQKEKRQALASTIQWGATVVPPSRKFHRILAHLDRVIDYKSSKNNSNFKVCYDRD